MIVHKIVLNAFLRCLYHTEINDLCDHCTQSQQPMAVYYKDDYVINVIFSKSSKLCEPVLCQHLITLITL